MAAKLSHGFCADIVAHMPDGVAYCEMIFNEKNEPIDWVYLEVNENFEKLTGLQNPEGKRVTELIPGIHESNPELFELYGRVTRTKLFEKIQTHVPQLSRWFSVLVYSPGENHFVAIFEDITKEKQIEQEQKDLLENLRVEREEAIYEKSRALALFENIPDGVIAVDLNGCITHVNPAAEEMLHWGAHEAIGRMFYDVVTLSDLEGAIPVKRRPLQVAMTTGKPFVTTLEDAPLITRKDHTVFSVMLSAAPIITDRVVGGVVVIHDVTREKELDRSKSEFISIASHQLRTPLSTIAWYAEALLALHLGPLLGPQKKYVEEIAHMDARMIELVNALLSVSRIDLGTFKIAAEPVQLSEVVDAVLLELAKPIADRGLFIEKDYTCCKKPIMIDKNAIHMIFQNLLANAVVYNKKGGSITVRIVIDGEAHITIANTGCGIPRNVQANIFGKFFRADNAREVEPGGTGIGLYIVRSLLRYLGGSVWFESEENKGATFHVIMPVTPLKKDL